MMKHRTTHTQSIEIVVDQTLSVLNAINDIQSMQGSHILQYMDVCKKIPERIQKGRLKIAVVGVIKSGKSTLVNAILGKEVVKRGAGVITSITTRIRKGNRNRATIYFRSWDDINSQLQDALNLFPAADKALNADMSDDFDLRRKKDRESLQNRYTDFINKNPRLPENHFLQINLIKHALEGFDHCHKLIQADEAVLNLETKAFNSHTAYTADPDKAFYLKDICLEVFGKNLDPSIELADCQGADSTDPAQLSRILNYLESANLIVYCVSSRTGLRRSDLSFLKQIKGFGLENNIIFINNCDLTEHESIEDLIKIENSVSRDLAFLNINPRVFSISALYNLFVKRGSTLRKKDKGRLSAWQTEKKMIAYCDDQTNAFNRFFNTCMNKDRYTFLFSNHLNRLRLILKDLDEHTNLSLGLVSTDKKKEDNAKDAIEMLYLNSTRLESIVTNSLEGAINGLKTDLKTDLNQIFKKDDTGILKNTQQFIQDFNFDVNKYKSIIEDTGFNQILYLMFQDFKQHFEFHMINKIQPEIKKFVLAQEKSILSHFQSLFDSYQLNLAQSDQYGELKQLSQQIEEQKTIQSSIDIQTIKQILGLNIPRQVFKTHYSPRVKVNAMAGFGLETMFGLFATMMNKNKKLSFSTGLTKASDNIKKENLRGLKKQFALYHQHLYSDYFLPLIEAASRDFKEKIKNRFSRYHIIKDEMEHLIQLKSVEKTEEKKKIVLLKSEIKRILNSIDEFPGFQ